MWYKWIKSAQEIGESDQCRDCGVTSAEEELDYNEWFEAWLCNDCEHDREIERDAHMYQQTNWDQLSDDQRWNEIRRLM